MIRQAFSFVIFSFVLGASFVLAEVPKQADAKEQLHYASEIRKEAKGLKGEEKEAQLRKALEAYSAVGSHFPESKAQVADACFRSGEILGSLKKFDEAREAFGKILELGEERKLSARALLEIGDLYRQEKKIDQAISSYEKTATQFGDQTAQRDQAWIWVGKLYWQQEKKEPARFAWRKVMDGDGEPARRISAFDLMAVSYLQDNDVKSAHEVVEKCIESFSSLASEENSKGRRIKEALEKMKSRK